jgi:hypothetical protein
MKPFLFKLNICFLVFLIIVLTGCSKAKPTADKNVGWQDEVLLAVDCGSDGLKCCENTNPTCRFGQQCCSDPQDPKNNFCSDDCSCGKENKFCCATDQKCDSGLACSGGRCLKCGQEREPCCSADKCEGELVCSGQKCLKCGIAGNPCCSSEPLCADQNKNDSQRSECQNGLCQICGASGNISCTADPKCNKNHLLNNNICYPCGNFNNPCCDTNSATGYECNPDAGLECKLGFCGENN